MQSDSWWWGKLGTREHDCNHEAKTEGEAIGEWVRSDSGGFRMSCIAYNYQHTRPREHGYQHIGLIPNSLVSDETKFLLQSEN